MIVPADDNLILSLHAYCPDDYAFNRLHSRKVFDESVDTDIEKMFGVIEKYAKPLGLPIMLTEYGIVNKMQPDGSYSTSDNVKWVHAYLKRAKAMGIPCIWWDNGYLGSGDEYFALLNRQDISWYMPEIVDAIMEETR